jgi:hypothetical protein
MQGVIVRIEKALEHLANEKDFIFQAVFNQDDLPYSLYCLFNALMEREELESITRHMTRKESDLFLDLALYPVCQEHPSRQPVGS